MNMKTPYQLGVWLSQKTILMALQVVIRPMMLLIHLCRATLASRTFMLILQYLCMISCSVKTCGVKLESLSWSIMVSSGLQSTAQYNDNIY